MHSNRGRRHRGRSRQPERSGTESAPEENYQAVQDLSEESELHSPRYDSASPPSSQHQSVDSGFSSSSYNETLRNTADCSDMAREQNAGSDQLEKLGIELKQNLKLTAAFPRRPGFGNLGKRVKLISNCYPIQVPSGNVYHYDVEASGVQRIPGECSGSDESSGDEAADGVTGEDRNVEKYRCLKTKEKRKVIEAMLGRDAIFDGLYAAFDGEKNLYTRRPLPGAFPHVFTTTKDDKIQGRVTIKPVKKKDTMSCAIDLDSIHAYYEKRTNFLPLEAIAALETILRHCACLRLTPIGRSFFLPPKPGNLTPIGGGVEIWFGYHQSIRIGQWQPIVNLDISAAAFYQEISLLEYIAGLLKTSVEGLRRKPFLTESETDKINRNLENKKVEATHSKFRRKYTILKLRAENAHDLHVDLKVGKETVRQTIAQYFAKRYRKELKFSNLPCLQATPVERNVYLPIEFCRLIPGQHYNKELTAAQKSEMIKFTSPTPKQRFREIDSIVNFKRDKCAQAFDLEVSEDPLRLEGRILDPPNLIYKDRNNNDDARVRPWNGTWNMKDVTFSKGAEIKSWVLISFAQMRRFSLTKLCELVKETGRKLGIKVNEPRDIRVIEGTFDIRKLLLSMKNEHSDDLALIVIPEEKKSMYKDIKKSAETVIGLITQCVLDKTVAKITHAESRSASQLVTNIFLKINSKMGGHNYSLVLSEIPSVLWKPAIIIGADVNHPGSFRGFKDSFAACAGSLDARCSLYAVRTRAQKSNDQNKKTVEIIADLESMVIDLLRAFYRHTRQKPEKIIFYRDGVSEGEFQNVKNEEVTSVRKACLGLSPDYQPGLTFIVVQKRHHMRFMPEDSRGLKNLNIPAGTVIDTVVTHAENFDFLLNSQSCPKGTARPAHYTVIEDDNEFTANDLQKFTNQLCYTYVRCTKSISIPAPVAYAHLAAYRASQYRDAGKQGSTANDCPSPRHLQPSIEELNDSTTVVQELKNRMYFV